jgi:hypothetical protein
MTLVVLTMIILVMPFAIANDFAEAIWGIIQELETWQVDEILLALFLGLVASLIVAFMQIASLRKQVAQLGAAKLRNISDDSYSDNQSTYTTKCALCSKYQLSEERWLKEAEYITARLHTKIIAGVCPDCEHMP